MDTIRRNMKFFDYPLSRLNWDDCCRLLAVGQSLFSCAKRKQELDSTLKITIKQNAISVTANLLFFADFLRMNLTIFS